MIKNKERIPLNEYTIKTISGVRYKVYSIYTENKDFKKLFEDLIITKAVQRQNKRCGNKESAL